MIERHAVLQAVGPTGLAALDSRLGGGWPLNVFMTPERKPFFGGTYFPPAPKDGQAGFLDVIERIHGAWTDKESEIRGNADLLTSELARVLTTTRLAHVLDRQGRNAEAARRAATGGHPRRGSASRNR